MLRSRWLPLVVSLLVSASGCATIVGAGIGYAVNGSQGARRGAAAGAEIDGAIFASAAATSARRRAAPSLFRCEGIETPASPLDIQSVYRSDALYNCEEELRQACQCNEIY